VNLCALRYALCIIAREMELKQQKNYRQAFDVACTLLRKADLEERSKKAGGIYKKEREKEEVTIPFFSEPNTIRFPQFEFFSPFKKAISLVARILVLHYLARADGTPVTGKWVGYKDIPGGLLYASVFERRVANPLAKKFGDAKKMFAQAGLKMGGRSEEIGDTSFILQAFPRVPLQYVLWEGDDEFPPNVQLLLDSSVDHYLSLEDVVVLGQLATGRLIHQSQVIV